ncbi:Holliday junction branch migration protein RuvA [Candidatus Saccharibacteria bacterium]|nr:Holliday junction branch migration protein RuvA [Candidatus Saccharibacteria bacterium]
MIARISGVVIEKIEKSVIVDVNGVGYEVWISDLDYERVPINDEVIFHVHHHISEQSQKLFGFLSLASKRLFELLISVNGVGPRAGLAILSLGESEEVRNAIANADVKFISTASGVGKKSAERAIIDLQDKVGVPSAKTSSARKVDSAKLPKVKDDAVDALIALGYSLNDAVDALVGIDETLDLNERVRLALKGGKSVF